MATQTESIQQLYIAYFNRPADAGGLAYWENVLKTNGGNTAAISTAFSHEGEYTAAFAGLANDQIVSQIYMNLFNRLPDAGGLNYWTGHLADKSLTISSIVDDIARSAANDTRNGPDTVAIKSKVAAAVAFTDYLNTDVAARLAYSTKAAAQIAKEYVHSVTDASSLVTATSDFAALGKSLGEASAPVGETFKLTTLADTIIGGAGNDIITAVNTPVADLTTTWTDLDTIDGGAGTDTVIITDTLGGVDLSKVSMVNVEKLKVVSVGVVASGDVSGFTGLTSASFTTKDAVGAVYTAATTTEVTVANTGAGAVEVVGAGGVVNIKTGAAAVVVGDTVANKITSAVITGGSTVAITDRSGAAAAVGTKLTSVSLNGNTGAAALTGDALTSVSITKGVAASDVGITNTKAHALTVKINDSADLTVTDTTATTVNVVASGKDSTLAIAAVKATALNVSGAADLTVLTAGGADLTAVKTVTATGSGLFTADLSNATVLTTVDATGATGGVDIKVAGTNGATVAAAQTVTTGAGDDTVTITGSLGKGGVLSLGGGSDTVKISGGGVIAAGAVVDAGDGVDTLSLAIVGSSNVGAFKNFENFDVAGLGTNFDAAIIAANNTVTNFVGTAAAGTAVTLSNLGDKVGFIVQGDMGTNAVTLTQATAVTLTQATAGALTQATAGALTITSDVDEAKADTTANTSAATLSASNATSINVVFDNNNVDKLADFANSATLNITGTKATTVSVVSGGTEVVNHLNFATVKGTTAEPLTSVTVTGDKALVLDIVHTGGGAAALATLDASGQTDGGLSFNTIDLTATGTIKLGAGDDNITVMVSDTSAVTSAQKISGLEAASKAGLTSAVGVDLLTFGGTVTVKADHTATDANDFAVKDGVVTFGGAGPTTLALAVAKLDTILAANETAVFNLLGHTYVVNAGAGTTAADNMIVELVGTTVHGIDASVTGHVYVF